VNGWKFVLPEKLIKYEVPDMEHWPFEKKWNPLEMILNQDVIDETAYGHMAAGKIVF